MKKYLKWLIEVINSRFPLNKKRLVNSRRLASSRLIPDIPENHRAGILALKYSSYLSSLFSAKSKHRPSLGRCASEENYWSILLLSSFTRINSASAYSIRQRGSIVDLELSRHASRYVFLDSFRCSCFAFAPAFHVLGRGIHSQIRHHAYKISLKSSCQTCTMAGHSYFSLSTLVLKQCELLSSCFSWRL